MLLVWVYGVRKRARFEGECAGGIGGEGVLGCCLVV